MQLHTPHIITSRKSLGGEIVEQRVIVSCVDAAYSSGARRLLPVIWQGRVIAWMGRLRGKIVSIRHQPWLDKHIDHNGVLFGYTGEDDVIAQTTTTGQYFHSPWSKTLGSGPGSHWAHFWALQGTQCGQWDGTAYTSKDRTDATLGALPHGGNVSPKTKYMLNSSVSLGGVPSISGAGNVYMPYDLVRSYDNCTTINGTQTFTNTGTAPPYCGSGDPGLDIMSVSQGANGNIVWTTVLYTNDSGTAGKTADSAGLSTVFSAAPKTPVDQWTSAFEYSGGYSMLTLGPAAGDYGARQIDSVAWPATGATVAVVLGRLLAFMPNFQSGFTTPFDWVKQINSLPVVKDGACLTMAKYEWSLGHQNNGHIDFGVV